MRNKKVLVVGALLCAVLATAGIAVATTKVGAVTAASATFNAATVANEVQKTCTVSGSSDTYQFTRARYTGTAVSSDARLNGPITVRTLSLVDTTTGVGGLVGAYRIVGGNHAGAAGRIEAAISGEQATGAIRGHVAGPAGELFASFGSGFTGNGGFSNAAVGSGSSNGAGVVLSQGACVHTIHLNGVKVKLWLKLGF